jgi:hypothetical protein
MLADLKHKIYPIDALAIDYFGLQRKCLRRDQGGALPRARLHVHTHRYSTDTGLGLAR